MMEDNSLNSTNLYGSNLETSTNNNNEIFNTDIKSLKSDYDYDNHYFCTKCHKFPFVKFCKNRKNVKITCSCFNNRTISIEEFFKMFSIEGSLSIFLSKSNLNINIENELICKKHNKTFKGFSKFFLNNFCEDCNEYHDEIYYNDIIKFDEIRIEENKIKEINEKINNNQEISEEISEEESNNFEIIEINESTLEKISGKENKRFKKLINIIINDYKNYPNFTHYFNIKNLLYFFKIEDKSIEKEENTLDDNLIEKNESIIIEYINNISDKTKLFSKIFVKNNKNKCSIEIEGKRIEIIEDYEFKTKERKVRVKLFINKNILEINMYKMFANCKNLVYVNGISKTNKITNINKIFYNCISLSSIPDFKDWNLKKYNGYLMFYNCISLEFFPYENELNKYDEGFLGILITKYLKYNKEIIINNINEDKEGYINLFKNRIKVEDKNKKIIILDGKDDERELIVFYKFEEKENEDELIILNENENSFENDIKIKLRIINKMKDMKKIIEKKELELTKWNINNVKNLGELSYRYESVSFLTDISRWVDDISFMFYGCASLPSLPDISKWNTSNITNMGSLFCR